MTHKIEFNPLQATNVHEIDIADFACLQSPQTIVRPVCQDCQRFSVPVFGFATPCSESPDGAHRNIVEQPVPRAHVASMLYAAYQCESTVVLKRLTHHFQEAEMRALFYEGKAQSGGNARE